jgi:PilZ domain
VTERTNPPPGGLPPGPGGSGFGSKLPSGVNAMRRGGARREVTERVTLWCEDGRVLEGWALNVSRGGLRAILEDKVILGQKFEVGVGTDEVIQRSGRIVWIQEEPDGVIVGIEFTGVSGTHKSVPPPPPGAQSEPLLTISATAGEPASEGEAPASSKKP